MCLEKQMERRIKSSEPDFKRVDELMTKLNWIVNPQLFFDVNPDLPELEMKVVKQEVLNELEETLNERDSRD